MLPNQLWATVCIGLTCCLLLAGSVAAQPEASAAHDSEVTPAARADYQRIVEQAVAEFEGARFAEARSLFLRAHEIMPSARTFRTLGMTAFELRLYPRAMIELQAALDDPRRPLDAKQQRKVSALLEQTQAFVGRYTLQISPAAVELQVDGIPLLLEAGADLVLAVGSHDLRVRAPGHAELRRTLLVQGREREALSLTLEPLAVPTPAQPPPAPVIREVQVREAPRPIHEDSQRSAPRPDARRPLAITAFSLGAAGVVVSAVMGGLALQRRTTVQDDEHCPNEVCPPAYADDLDQMKRFANTATAGAVIGAVGLGVGTYLWIAAARASHARSARALRLAPRLGLGTASLAGRF